jgi:hypothetical protein
VEKEFKMKNTKLFPYTLQFFAEDGDDGQGGNDDGQNVNNDGQKQNDDNQNGGKGEKTFTQDEVNRMMTREKQQGKNSVLNALGFKTEDEAKNAFNLLKALQDSQKSEADKMEESKNTAIQEKANAEHRAAIAEAKLSCIVNGVDKEAVDDVLVIAMSKVTDDKPLDTVLTEMKSEAKYASFFGSSNNNNGGGNTGRTPQNNNNGGDNNNTNYGETLAKRLYADSKETKSKFF